MLGPTAVVSGDDELSVTSREGEGSDVESRDWELRGIAETEESAEIENGLRITSMRGANHTASGGMETDGADFNPVRDGAVSGDEVTSGGEVDYVHNYPLEDVE
jgi:hypothetical protein